MAGVATLLLLALISAAVLSRPRSSDNQGESVRAPGPEWANADRLVVPDYGETGVPPFVPFRPRRETWSEQEIGEYWLDPQEIGLEVLDERVESYIRELLREVP